MDSFQSQFNTTVTIIPSNVELKILLSGDHLATQNQ